LLLLIIFIIGLRYIVPERKIVIEEIPSDVRGNKNPSEFLAGDMSHEMQDFSFYPNSESYDTFIKPGLTAIESGKPNKYRNRGVKFRNQSEINESNSKDDEKPERLNARFEAVHDNPAKLNTGSSLPQRPLLDINKCDSLSLVRLPGIGPVLSARIIKYRHFLGGFARIEQLKEVYGLPVETFDRIKHSIYADSAGIRRISINTADFKEIAHLPYLEKSDVKAIVKYRELKGGITGIVDLIENKLISEEKAKRVRPYINFE
jgi:competence protein ComEA